MSFYNFFFVANRIGSETSQQLPNESSPQKLFQLARDLFILMDSAIICIHFRNNLLNFLANFLQNNCSFPDQEHVGHYANKITEKGLEFFIKSLLTAI